jgi:ERF superfamily
MARGQHAVFFAGMDQMSDTQSTAPEVSYQQVAVAPPSVPGLETTGGGGLLAMIERLATNPQLNIEVFDRLLAARRQEEDRAAERAFNAAMSIAKGELSPVLKTRDVDFQSAKPGAARTKYKYESFADVAKVVDPVFAAHGLAYRFAVAQGGELVKVTCIVSHSDGYSERVTVESKVDPGSTGMSMVQALGSAMTYLQRYSLRAAIGLAAGVDDDGKAAGGTSPKIVSEQANELRQLFDEVGRSPAGTLNLIGVADIEDMTVDQFMRVRAALTLAKTEQRGRKNTPGNDNAPRNS